MIRTFLENARRMPSRLGFHVPPTRVIPPLRSRFATFISYSFYLHMIFTRLASTRNLAIRRCLPGCIVCLVADRRREGPGVHRVSEEVVCVHGDVWCGDAC